MGSRYTWMALLVAAFAWCGPAGGDEPAEQWRATMDPLRRSIDLTIGQSAEVTLSDGSTATVELLGIEVDRDSLRQAVRDVRVRVTVNGEPAVLPAALYHLPREVGGVQVDCPIVAAYLPRSRGNWWGLTGDARLRLWPAGSPWVRPGTYGYPVKQRWFASPTQMANEPVYVDFGEWPSDDPIYYHNGLDIGGVEDEVEVVAAAAGVVITAGAQVWDDAPRGPRTPRDDKVMVLDDRGWYHTYYHLASIDPAVRPGTRVALGQRIGLLGKAGHSGGWAHLHYGVTSRHGRRWGTEEAYAFLWQAYRAEQDPKVIAVARPHHLAAPGETVTLDARKSWAASGRIASYAWTFTDGTTASGATVERRYDTPGQYSEVLRVTDDAGHVDIDFAVVQVIDPARPRPLTLHLAHQPTLGVTPGDAVTFVVRAFGTTAGRETLDFGDGTEPATLASDGAVDPHAPHGYAVTTHRFAKPGHYIVTARRTDEHGHTATMRVHVVVQAEDPRPQASQPVNSTP